jgi:branched-chain amino acid transport system substrate-binding protein
MEINRREMALLIAGAASTLAAGRASAANKEIAIGGSVPLSGPGAATGITTQRTFQHAVDLVNAQGIEVGGDRYTFKVTFYDNKYVPAEAVTIVEKLLADGTRFLYSLGSGNSVPVVAKTTAAKCLQMSLASGKAHLTSPEFPLSFRIAPTNETAWAVYPWLKTAYPKVKKIGHMNPSDEAGFTESEDRTMIAEKNGFANVVKEFFKRGSTDFYPVATRLVAANPDLIDFGGTIGRDQALGCKALRELGYKGEILLGYSDVKSFIEVAGADAAERTILFDTLVEPQNDKQKELEAWWLKSYGPPFPSFAYTVYDMPFVLAQAIRKAQSVDPVAIAKVMTGMEWDGLYGKARFGMKLVYGVDTTITRPIPMAIVKGGKPVQIGLVPWPANV